MIPVTPQPEPDDFQERVAVPGALFLKTNERPKSTEWKNRDYWRRALPELGASYGGVCAYCAIWRPHDARTVDHFIAKSVEPSMAYRWDNFRLASRSMNTNKGTHIVLDPFALDKDTFQLDIPSMQVVLGEGCPSSQADDAALTLTHLKLNVDEELLDERNDWVHDFACAEVSLNYLQRRAPFITAELVRQAYDEPGRLREVLGINADAGEVWI